LDDPELPILTVSVLSDDESTEDAWSDGSASTEAEAPKAE
jgi:hypothetical protein